MRGLRTLVFVTLAVPIAQAQAGIFSRTPKPNPAERVPELIIQLKTGATEAKRLAAAEELRQFDAKAYPEIIPALADALSNDKDTGVRAESASAIGRLRPINSRAGQALEQAVASDSSLRVRMAARQSLLQYQIVGYRSGKSTEPANPGTSAVAGKGSTPPPAIQPSRPSQTAKVPVTGKDSGEPPLAPAPMPTPPPALDPVPTAPSYQPLPNLPAAPAAPPSQGPALSGPALEPPG